MRDERLRDLQRRATTEGDAGEVDLLQARLRAGELTLEQVELAAYLGNGAAQGALDLEPPHVEVEEFLWGLCDWGHSLQLQACLAAVRAAVEPWRGLEPIRRALEMAGRAAGGQELEPEEVEAAVTALREIHTEPIVLARTNLDPLSRVGHFQAASLCIQLFLVAGPREFVDRSSSRSAAWVLGTAGDLLPGGMESLLALLERELARDLLARRIPGLERVDMRARARLEAYGRLKAANPEHVRALEERGWEFLTDHSFDDDTDSSAASRPAYVKAHWCHGSDVTLLKVFVHLVPDPQGRKGFTYHYTEDFEHAEVQTRVPADFVTQPWFEAAMLAWSCLRSTTNMTREFQRIGDVGLKVYLDDERTPPPGWLLVRWPEEAIAILMTCQVEALSLDHDLGDEGDERTGYTVLQWLEEQVATCGFEPPEELAVHSANASAAIKMRSAIESIQRLAARAREG